MLLEVSIGEALDKFSILEIKFANIQDNEKHIEIQREIETLTNVHSFIHKYILLYKLLVYVNTTIWNLQDADIPDFQTIFRFNQQRFRIKNIINMSESGIREQKGYTTKQVRVEKNTSISMLLWLALNYDILHLDYLPTLKLPCMRYNTNVFVPASIPEQWELDMIEQIANECREISYPETTSL
jgi:hypothetical protein